MSVTRWGNGGEVHEAEAKDCLSLLPRGNRVEAQGCRGRCCGTWEYGPWQWSGVVRVRGQSFARGYGWLTPVDMERWMGSRWCKHGLPWNLLEPRDHLLKAPHLHDHRNGARSVQLLKTRHRRSCVLSTSSSRPTSVIIASSSMRHLSGSSTLTKVM